ncbi:dipeptide ABC transporter ATP-binding protein [Natronobacterium texcoconense]|uniref:Nickel import system ATP-binding protein NikD n=1 Tax=Natronobacterium texcoconense TaxID=1095778 RepID=A0A1H1J1K9_NATTX|nr:ABC transporter ATP-binding protein [Natronobacterium texcoconense]SDR43418.1 peptide/nickel transport system ATP-binding protein [Natronobacterium texcoconense]
MRSIHTDSSFDVDSSSSDSSDRDTDADQPLLAVDDLHTQFRTPDGVVRAVDGASLTVGDGEIVGLVGESGFGKSVTARSIVGLQEPGEITDGTIQLDGIDVTEATGRELRRLRGTTVSMVFQNPTETLNPVFDVGEQIAESFKVHDRPDSQRLLDYLHVPPFSRRSEWRDYRDQAVDLMEQVGIASPEDRVDAYPHELSGGMCQRASIAIALATDPALLIADEPTTALDATTQAQLLDRFRQLNEERDTAILLITHDLGVVAELCDRVVVMYDGDVVETGPTERILESPRHPYTRSLLECLPQRVPRGARLPTIEGTVPEPTEERTGCSFAPRCDHATDACRDGEIPTVEFGDDLGSATCGEPSALEDFGRTDHPSKPSAATTTGRDVLGEGDAGSSENRSERRAETRDSDPPLVELEGVSKRYSLADGMLERLLGTEDSLRAVTDVDLTVLSGETVALVGESGCGKSTLANLVTGLETPTEGTIRFGGRTVGRATERAHDDLADVGVVFQDPRSSLNPRLTVEKAVAEPLHSHGWDRERREARVQELLEQVGVPERHATSYPHELSGGQVQRVAIARAIALDPRLVVLDEPVSALDVSVQARILNLLADLQAELDLTYLCISHDLGVVEHVADRVAVMYLGELMEVGPVDYVFDRPSHPYTKALLEAIPSVDANGEPSGRPLSGSVPSPIDPPDGCAFRTRCPRAEPDCANRDPDQQRLGPVRSKCHFPE